VTSAIASPCVNLCALDPGTGWCRGCGRTGDEIGCWPGAGDALRRAILARLPARLAMLRNQAAPNGST
jgi:uncharacterized protein